jgi:hypothetical protein
MGLSVIKDRNQLVLQGFSINENRFNPTVDMIGVLNIDVILCIAERTRYFEA